MSCPGATVFGPDNELSWIPRSHQGDSERAGLVKLGLSSMSVASSGLRFEVVAAPTAVTRRSERNTVTGLCSVSMVSRCGANIGVIRVGRG